MTASVLPTPMRTRRLVAGLGHVDRGDDGFGPAVVRTLRESGRSPARLVDCPEGPSALLDLWEGVTISWIVDAVVSGAAPGTLHVRDARTEPIPRELGAPSSHGLALRDVVDLAGSLGRLPQRLTILGVEASSFSLGDPMSPAVRAQVRPVAERILEEATKDA
ncbi:MAG: hydrogenase maturation protease [Thermoplasmata archaeon]